jgi:hypothetical protein
MKARNVILGTAATLAAAGSFALPTVASAHVSATSISKVSIKMVAPSTVTTQGAFTMQVSGTGTFKSFDIYWRATGIGTSYVLLKHGVNGKSYKATVAPASDGQVTFEMVPWSGLNGTGSTGAPAYSVSFYPLDIASGQNDCSVTNGTWTSLTGSKWFGGEAIETTGPATVYCYGGYDYNDGLVIGTGPGGTTGKVYINSATTGTNVNFSSSTTKGFVVGYKAGQGVPMNYNSYKIVTTGSGHMWFTGIVEASYYS